MRKLKKLINSRIPSIPRKPRKFVTNLLPNKKKVNRYFHSIPITNYREAKALGSRTNWEVIEALRDAGGVGLTAKELMRDLGLSKNTVYGAIRFLEGPSEDSSWVTSRRPRKRPGKPDAGPRTERDRDLVGSATRIYVEEIPFGRAYIDEDFIKAIDPVIKKGVSELREKYLEIIDLAVEECKKDVNKKFFPKLIDEPCEECKVSHEVLEFVEAISYCLHMELYYSTEEKIFPKHKFGHPKLKT